MGLRRSVRLISGAAAISLLLGVTGCALEGEDPPKPSAEPEITATPTAEPEPKQTAESVLPKNCDDLISPESIAMAENQLRALPDSEAQSFLEGMLGPKAYAAVLSGSPRMYCGWAIPQSGAIVAVGVAVVEDQMRAELNTAFIDSIFAETQVTGTDWAFTRGQSSDHKYNVNVGFTEDVLVAVTQTVAGAFFESVVTSVNRVNTQP